MDAIDELRLRLATLEARLSIAETHLPANSQDIVVLDERLSAIEFSIANLQAKLIDAENQAISATLGASAAQTTVYRLINQVAIVAATLGSAIYALKKGDAEQSSQALTDALQSQERLGAMLNDYPGKSR